MLSRPSFTKVSSVRRLCPSTSRLLRAIRLRSAASVPTRQIPVPTWRRPWPHSSASAGEHLNWTALAALAASFGMGVSCAVCEPQPEPNGVQNEASQVYTGKPNSKLVLAADCGGTTTRLMMYKVNPKDPIQEKMPAPGELVKVVRYQNVLFGSLDQIIENFLKEVCMCGNLMPHPSVAVLAVAGVAAHNSVRYTNLDWVVDGYELERKLGIPKVEVINDFVAQGYGTMTLGDDEVIRLNDATPLHGETIACIGAGTGLGECFLVPDADGQYRCFPSEGGHVEFAPRGAGCDSLQMDLLKHLKIKFSGWNRISVERVVSGRGICNVYEFLAYQHPGEVDKRVHDMFKLNPSDASIIAMNADPGSLCEKALQIFASCYGAHVGTLALHFMPFKGLYVTGGVTKKNLKFLLEDHHFMRAYLDKGRVSSLLEKVPLYFVKSDDMGERGVHYRAVQLLKEREARKGVPETVPKQSFDYENLPLARDVVPNDLVPPDVPQERKVMSDALREFLEEARSSPVGREELSPSRRGHMA